jgi:drug/metabolite transporter (DMT)-like permease
MLRRAVTRSRDLLLTAAALLYVLLWSSGFVAAKVCVRYCPPLTLLSVRFFLATGLMWGLAHWLGLRRPATPRAWLRLSMIGALNLALPLAFNFIALRQVTAGMAAIVAATNPLLLALVAPRLLGEALTARRLLGLVLGFGGVVFVMATRLGAGGRTDTPVGVVLLFSHVVSLVCATILFKRFPPRESLLVVNAVQMLVSAVLLLLPALFFEDARHAVVNLPFVVSFVYLLFVLSIGASLLWFWLLSRGEASVASSYLFLSPLMGLIFATAFLGESMSARDGLGLIATMTGIALIRR